MSKEGLRPQAQSPALPRGEAKRGLLLGRLSKRDRRLWRDIESVVTTTDASGAPRSPTLRRLWEWARTSVHVIHVEMVSPSELARGRVGVFRVELVDPAARSHVVVIRLCPWNIRYAKAAPGPNAVESFVRFEGLTEVERHAEVLAHELAHAEYYPVYDAVLRLREPRCQEVLDDFTDPNFDPLRGNPRFEKLAQGIWTWAASPLGFRFAW